jgi:hypothetical protein
MDMEFPTGSEEALFVRNETSIDETQPDTAFYIPDFFSKGERNFAVIVETTNNEPQSFNIFVRNGKRDFSTNLVAPYITPYTTEMLSVES